MREHQDEEASRQERDEGALGRSRQAPEASRRKRRQRLANHLTTNHLQIKGSRLRWNIIGQIRLERQTPDQRRQGTKTVKYRGWGHQSGRTPEQKRLR